MRNSNQSIVSHWAQSYKTLLIFLFFISCFFQNTLCRADITTGLVGWWKFDEATSGTCTGALIIDSSGNGYTGTCNNSPTWVNGKIGGGMSFNGSSNYVETPSIIQLGVGFNGTVSFWAKGSGDSEVSNNRTGPAQTGDGAFMITSTGQLEYYVDSNGNPPYTYTYTTTTTSNTNIWNFYVAQLNVPSSSGNMTGVLYVNGVANPFSVAIIDEGNGNYPIIDIGRRRNYTYGTGYFSGSIDDVRIYNRALSASDVAQLYGAHTHSFSHVHLANFHTNYY